MTIKRVDEIMDQERPIYLDGLPVRPVAYGGDFVEVIPWGEKQRVSPDKLTETP